MATFGGVSCSFVRGEAAPLTERASIWQLPGHNGYGIQHLGTGDAECAFALVYFSSIANVAAWLAAVQALKGSIVSVENDWGTTYNYIYVARLSAPMRGPAWHAGGCRGEIRVQGVRLL